MGRLPTPGSDNGIWGTILNDFLMVAHEPDGTLKDGIITADQIQDGAIETAKLSGGIQASLAAAVTQMTLDKSWLVAGTINVAAGDVDFIAPVYMTVPTGFTATLTGVRALIHSGTGVNLRITQNGATISGLGAVNATTSGTGVSGLSVSVADGDLLAPVVNSTSGGPQNMTVTISYTLAKT